MVPESLRNLKALATGPVITQTSSASCFRSGLTVRMFGGTPSDPASW